MSTLSCIESYINKEKNYYGSFLIEPLEIGQGITVGNALRRTLLSDLTGFAITGVRINDLKHEFAVVEGLREDILEILLNLIGKKRFIFPLPLPLARLSAKFFQLFPKPLLTEDQLRLLKYDNIPSGRYKTNSEIGVPSKLLFDAEVKKYCFMWKEGGQFATEKYNKK